MDEKKLTHDEISLVDILKKIWQYKVFIIIFCIIGVLISFTIFFYIEKANVNKDKTYQFEIVFPSITFDQYNDLKLKMQYDNDTRILQKIFKINMASGNIRYYIKGLNFKDNNYSFSAANFPVSLLGIQINVESTLDEKLIDRFKSYLQSILFYTMCKSDLTTLKRPFLDSKEIMIQNIDKSSSQIFIFIIKLSEKLDSIYSLENLDIDKNYNQFIDFINEIDLSDNIIKDARDLLIEMIDTDYQLIKRNTIISIEYLKNNGLHLNSIIKKTIIIAIVLFFLSIFLVFVIDFFRENWKEIVR